MAMDRFAIRSLVGKSFRGRACARSIKTAWFGPLGLGPGQLHQGGLAFVQRNFPALKDYLKRGVISVEHEGRILTVGQLSAIVGELTGKKKSKKEKRSSKKPVEKVEVAPAPKGSSAPEHLELPDEGVTPELPDEGVTPELPDEKPKKSAKKKKKGSKKSGSKTKEEAPTADTSKG